MRKIHYFIPLLFLLVSCIPSNNNKKSSELSEIDHRLNLVKDRITTGSTPTITRDFILAGVTLDEKFARRFTNYSGDQTGRYLTAMSYIDIEKNPINIHRLVEDIVANQKSDGRFGNESFSFKAEDIEGSQMALLWGNGRLLAGLLDYYGRYPKKTNALEAAKKLGDFVGEVTNDCTQPEIIERFKTMGALGFICFTQFTEGMAKLYEVTGDEKYRKTAETIFPLLPDFGNQHSHGYLNTLRGVAMLYAVTKNPTHLQFVENNYEYLINSPEYLITGGLPEFFAKYSSSDDFRDEGCSEADFLILSIQLWELTGKMKYLDQAEYTLVNHMFYNQFESGDFGHHHIKLDYGFIASTNIGKSWWCCNYHGINALAESKDIVISELKNQVYINLFFNSSYKNSNVEVQLEETDPYSFNYTLQINNLDTKNNTIALRIPYWAKTIKVLKNNKEVEPVIKEGYMFLKTKEKQNSFNIQLHPKLQFTNKNLKKIDLNNSISPFEAAIIYGPYLLAVDDKFSPLFVAEPSGNNLMLIYKDYSIDPEKPNLTEIPENSFVKRGYLQFKYKHDAMYETSTVILRPISESSYEQNANVRIWFKFRLKQIQN